MASVYIGLGSNLGDRKQNLQNALSLMQKQCSVQKVSSLYETEPVGYERQEWFLNCVAMVQTLLDSLELLLFLQSIERDLGRIKIVQNGPRIIDLDILLYDQEVLSAHGLFVPHPGMHERRFVLEPFAEINPQQRHPVLGKTVRELLLRLEDEKAVRMIPGVFFQHEK